MDRIPVFFTPDMLAANAGSYSPSAFKPAQVMADWTYYYGEVIEQRQPTEATTEMLCSAHDPGYVRDVLALERDNGFHNRDAGVAQSLPWTSGAMTSAAIEALDNRRVAVAPVSGFHHAHYDHGGGFCTFNGLMVAAMHLLQWFDVKRVGILDMDAHYGDGSQDIIEKLGVQNHIEHHSLGERIWATEPKWSNLYLHRLPELIEGRFSGCDIVLYQAGADAWIDDPLGAGMFTAEQIRERDRIVFETLRSLGIPCAWNLAGGYARDEKGTIEPVLALHRITMEECIRAYAN